VIAKERKVPPLTSAAEAPAVLAGRVTCNRPILARVASVTERVTCRLSVPLVRDPYWVDFESVATEVKVFNTKTN
jgi:hypothetical protein